MVNKKFLVGILAMVLVFGMSVVGCDNPAENNTNINGDWHLLDTRGSRTGSIINISHGEATLVAIGNTRDGFYNNVNNGNLNIGDVVFRNISRSHDTNTFIIYSMETMFQLDAGWPPFLSSTWQIREIWHHRQTGNITINLLRPGSSATGFRFVR